MYFTDHYLHSPKSRAEDLTPSLKVFYEKIPLNLLFHYEELLLKAFLLPPFHNFSHLTSPVRSDSTNNR